MGALIGTLALLATSTLLSPALSTSAPIVYSSSFIAIPATVAFAASSTAETLDVEPKDLVSKLALDHNIATSTLFNLVSSECTTWDPVCPGDWNPKKGIYCSWGLTQQNICAHPEISKDQATDPEWALNKAAQDIADGNEDIYTACNCYSLVWTKVPHLPRMADIHSNTKTPHKGDVAIFYYPDRKTGKWVKHIALVLEDGGKLVFEANKEPCRIDTRTIHLDDMYLAGYWSPDGV